MIKFLIDTLGRLSAFPGLGFLERYGQALLVKSTTLEQKIGDYQAQRDGAVSALKTAKDLPKNVKGSKKRG